MYEIVGTFRHFALNAFPHIRRASLGKAFPASPGVPHFAQHCSYLRGFSTIMGS